ncbi:DUF3108 domain-containing protein [Candidatus Omnitrophota bacterium]
MTRTSIVLIVILFSLLLYTIINIAPNGHAVDVAYNDQSSSNLPFKIGERLTYEVRYKKVRLGESILTFHGEKELNNKNVYHITFFTKIPTLKDTEELYAEKGTFLPLEVHRTIKKKLGFGDRIREIYDQKNFRVDIKQRSKLRLNEFSIQKDSPVHNAILLAYYYRTQRDFSEDERFKVALPTFDFDVIYRGIENIKTPLGEYRAYAFISEPPKFKLWLSADERKLPLKIENPGTLGYSLIIKSAN